MPDFVMVVGLLLLLVFGVVELALVLHLRAVVTAEAAEGARFEAAAGAERGSGGQRAEELLGSSVGDAVSSRVSCTSSRAREPGMDAALPPLVTVRCGGEVWLPLLPVGVRLDGVGRALLESP